MHANITKLQKTFTNRTLSGLDKSATMDGQANCSLRFEISHAVYLLWHTLGLIPPEVFPQSENSTGNILLDVEHEVLYLMALIVINI